MFAVFDPFCQSINLALGRLSIERTCPFPSHCQPIVSLGPSLAELITSAVSIRSFGSCASLAQLSFMLSRLCQAAEKCLHAEILLRIRCSIRSFFHFFYMCSGRETIKCPGCGDDIIPEQVMFISVQIQEALARIIKIRQAILFIQRKYSNLLFSFDV